MDCLVEKKEIRNREERNVDYIEKYKNTLGLKISHKNDLSNSISTLYNFEYFKQLYYFIL